MMIAITVTPSHTGLSSLGYEHFPLLVACALMLAAALINYYTLNVPNSLSLTGLLSAWLVALLLETEFIEPTDGGVASVMVSMTLGGVLLLPSYVTGCLEAGCVKMQAAYGAWLGCAYPIAKAGVLVSVTTIAGALLTTVVALAVWRLRKDRRSGTKQKRLFPAQVTLSLGSLVSLVVWLRLMG